jgi:hypothetical protein
VFSATKNQLLTDNQLACEPKYSAITTDHQRMSRTFFKTTADSAPRDFDSYAQSDAVALSDLGFVCDHPRRISLYQRWLSDE